MAAAVEVRELVKRYPKTPGNAVDGISFSVGKGEVFGLLGPNGAGKSTTIGILTTRVAATSGHASVGGVDVTADPVAAKRLLAVVPQRPNLDRALSARQNLVWHAAYHGSSPKERKRRADELLKEFGLEGRGDDRVDAYSGGQAQRLLIARAMMHRPEVLFLDEPSTGLDPQARLFVWDRVRDLRANGVTIVLTTHDMDEAQELTDRIGIVDHGTLLALDTRDNLVASLGGSGTVTIEVDPSEELLRSLRNIAGVERVDATATTVTVIVHGPAAGVLVPVTQALAAAGAAPEGLSLGEPSLEDVFISLTGRGLR